MAHDCSIPKLSQPHSEILPIYDVIVVGSGYGGAISASRCARAGQAVCVLEKGKEWTPGDFPETFSELLKNTQVSMNGKKVYGKSSDLYDFHIADGAKFLTGVGLGGGSLINANASLEQKRAFFEKPEFPTELRKDIDSLYDIDAQHYKDMMEPSVWPASSPYTEPGKMKELEKAVEGISGVDIEDLGKFIKKVPLLVNFKDEPNRIGIKQPSCNGCGNCSSGCNTGAKKTLNTNYLPDAKAHGAHIFTQIDVISVTRDSYSGLWLVRYKRDIVGDVKEQFIKSHFVFMAAGAIGTTKIILHSRAQGLSVSSCLGDNFTSSNDFFGFCHSLTDEVNCFGMTRSGDNSDDEKASGIQAPYNTTNPGAAVTTIVDLRSESLECSKDLIISDYAIPGALRNVFSAILTSADAKNSLSKLFEKGFLAKFKDVESKPIQKTLCLHSMSTTSKRGRIFHNQHGSDVRIKYEGEPDGDNIANVKERMTEIATKLGGTFIPEQQGCHGGYLSGHPFGGCIMAETGQEGVVNHKGQVFMDNSSDIHKGLYIVDSSIIPCDVGAPPVATLSMLIERCMRLCALDHGWHIDYDLSHDIVSKIGETSKQPPGLIMTERMVGELKMSETGECSSCEFKLTVESMDVKKMIELDPEHSAKMSGTVTCPVLSKEPTTISQGIFKLLRNSSTQVDGKEMIYSMVLNTVEGKQFYFHGIKLIHKDSFGEVGLRDTTVLYITVFEGKDGSGEPIGNGELYMKLSDFAEQLTTISVTNSKSFLERTRLTLDFVNFFAQSLWQTYLSISSGSLLDPNAPPRVKRPLKLHHATPVVYKIVTEDKVELRLTRIQGGKKGPIMLVHGLGVASSLFLMDTVDVNFVEYLVKHKYDVWLFDWRVSINLPWACYTQFNIDDVANYDFPAAVEKILEVTKEKDIQLVIHCFGAIACIASVLLGRLAGKVRSITTSQVSAIAVGSCVNRFKANSCMADLLGKLGVKSFTAYVDKDATWSEKTLNVMTRKFANIVTPTNEHCSSEVCHRITFMYGLLYEHKNLNVATHEILHEVFGPASMEILLHTSLVTRKRRLVSSKGKDIYLPGFTKKNRMKDEAFRKKMDLLNVPIMFFYGEENQCWEPDGLLQMYNIVKEANPNQDYVLYGVEDYGHLDGFMGKQAHIDVFPNLVRWLDKYAEDHYVRDGKARELVSNALAKDENRSSNITKQKSADSDLVLKLADELDKTKEILCDSDGESDCDSRESTNNDIINSESHVTHDLADASPTQLESVKTRLEEMLKKTSRLLWERKASTNSAFHLMPRYHAPESTCCEQVIIKTFTLNDNTRKREIFALSDLHLGVDWSKEIESRLLNFIATMARIAEEFVHSLVLVGDILEMCMTPMAVTPPTKEEFMTTWKSDIIVKSFADAVRKMADEDKVNVFYVRGDHDRDMTNEMIKELFGDKVIFVPGCLVLKLEIMTKQYTIRFEHGHSADIFSSYNYLNSKQTSSTNEEKPFSYYVTRALSSTQERFFSDTRDITRNFVTKTLNLVPPVISGSTFIDILNAGPLRKLFCEKLIEKAIGKDLTGEESVILDDEKWIRLSNIFKTKFLSRAIAQHGSSDVYEMLQSSIDDLSFHIKECHEDVVVMGHSHLCTLQSMRSKGGNTIYANCGTWIDLCARHSYVKIVPPTSRLHGEVELKYEENF
eukprot:gene205-819_t